MNKVALAIAAILVLGVAVFIAASYNLPAVQPPALEGTVVEITSSGFSPSTVTINARDKVTFVNRDTSPHWPASAQHPTHAVYPETGGCIGSKFDACKGLTQNETFTFTFNYAGEWRYHDHLNCCANPRFFGTIIVRETAPPPAAKYSIQIVGYPASINANTTFYINWRISSDRQINVQHTAVHYGSSSVPKPKTPTDYPGASRIQSGTIPGAFSAGLNIQTPGTYYFRAHAVVGGENVWSDEKTISVKAPPPTAPPARNFTIEADDVGFYIGGQDISSVAANKGDVMGLLFMVRAQNVYFGGLDFKGCGKIAEGTKPGGSARMEFVAAANCTITSFWPSSGVVKDSMQVIVR